ncbi:hypothetical protein HLRTI_000400 [Halorhabdus tiamatea SARL4B]|uniref:Uncharacterized protein n=1 Tax=Halorhabdus tiamatea SARL4B TaxID=1033806 RepID=F7PMD9_9EURY|nr:hypothetical protein [Halorhabdus tiamatea]ERJ07359.1 hypothetical protein HLRTI_000400 [Halorhabdus tiamatea SARL4B]
MRKPFEELSHEDIIFLKIIKEIEDDPEEYPHTSRSDFAANTRSIKAATDLSDRQVNYRIRPYDQGENRGLDHMGYVTIHDAVATDDGFTPRAVELTDQGRKALLTWEEKRGEVQAESLDEMTRNEIELELEQLRTKVTRLEDALAKVNEFDSNEYGAVDEDTAGTLEKTISLAASHYQVFTKVLGVPMDELREDMSEEEARRTVMKHLGISESEQPEIDEDSSEAPVEGTDSGL